MAIYIEEEKEAKGGLFGFGLLIVALIIIGIAAYYLFFVQPELISVVVPVELRSIEELTRIQFDPAQVVESSFFKGLRSYVPPQTLKPAGNSVPFGVF